MTDPLVELKGLVEWWRKLADEARGAGNAMADTRGTTLKDCADELSALIPALEKALAEARKQGLRDAKKAAMRSYAEASREGCDPNGAWDCAVDAIAELERTEGKEE